MFLCHVFLQGGQKEEREERQREGEWKREERSHERESAEEETDDVTHHRDPEIQARDQVSSGNTDRSHKLTFTSSVRQYIPLKSIFNWKNVKLIWL